jgi:hypothetical protein
MNTRKIQRLIDWLKKIFEYEELTGLKREMAILVVEDEENQYGA